MVYTLRVNKKEGKMSVSVADIKTGTKTHLSKIQLFTGSGSFFIASLSFQIIWNSYDKQNRKRKRWGRLLRI